MIQIQAPEHGRNFCDRLEEYDKAEHSWSIGFVHHTVLKISHFNPQRLPFGWGQLHGDVPRSSLGQIPASLQVTCVLHATSSGEIQTQLPGLRGEVGGNLVDWILIDGMQGGRWVISVPYLS